MENVKQMLQEGHIEIVGINKTTLKLKGVSQRLDIRPTPEAWEDFYAWLNRCVLAYDDTAKEPGANVLLHEPESEPFEPEQVPPPYEP